MESQYSDMRHSHLHRIANYIEIYFLNLQMMAQIGNQLTLSSFFKFVAHRYKASPVRKENELCPACKRPMTVTHRTSGSGPVLRILWHCARCNQSLWKNYRTESVRERKARWH